MYSLPVFNDDVNIARKNYLQAIEEIINGIANKKLAQSYEKRYETYVPADIRRVIRECKFSNQKQDVFKALTLITSFQLESQKNGSSFIFFNALIELFKLHNVFFENNDVYKTTASIFQYSRRANQKDYYSYLEWYIQDQLIINVLKNILSLTGNNGDVFIDKHPTNENCIELITGYTFKLHPPEIFLENVVLQKWKNHDVKIVIIDGMIERVSEIEGLLNDLSEIKQPALIFARSFSNEVISTLAFNKMRDTLDVIPIEVPYDFENANSLKDIAVIAGIDVRSSLKGELISTMKMKDLGTLKKVSIFQGKIKIEDEKNNKNVLAHAALLKEELGCLKSYGKAAMENETENLEKRRIISLRIKNLSSYHANVSLSKSLGESYGIMMDRLEIGLGILKDTCSMGIVDISKIDLNCKLLQKQEYLFVRNFIKRLKKMNISLCGTGALVYGIRGALSLAGEIRHCQTMINVNSG